MRGWSSVAVPVALANNALAAVLPAGPEGPGK